MKPRLSHAQRGIVVAPLIFALLLVEGAVACAQEYATAAELELMKGFPPPPGKQVTKQNALFPPFNRWSYQNMQMFLPSVDVPPAKQPSELKRAIDRGFAEIRVSVPDPSGKPGRMNAARYIPTKDTVSLATYLKETYTDSLVVIKGDKVVYEAYLNGMTENQPHLMMSVTKSFTGLFGLMAVADKKLKETDQVADHVKELKGAGAFKGATFQHVLDMTNSMSFTETYTEPNSGIVHYATVVGLLEPQPNKKYESSIHEYLLKLEKDTRLDHGAKFRYHTPNSNVVNWVTNRVTGVSFQGQLQDLWSKIGAAGPTYVLLDKTATPLDGSGLNATPSDLSRFAAMLLDDGKSGNTQVVPREIIQELSKGGSREAFEDAPSATGIMGTKDWSYRAMWWVRHTPGKEAFMACGISGQWIFIDVKRGIAIIKQSSQPTSATDYQTAYDILGFEAIVAHLSKP